MDALLGILDTALPGLFLKLLNMGISAGWLVLAVLLLRPLLKKAPKSFLCLLWGLVALRLVWPFSIESMASLLPSAQTLPPEELLSPAPQIHSGVTVIDRAVNPAFTASFTPSPAASVNPLQVWTLLASWIWALGAAAMAVSAAVSYLRLKRRVAPSAWHRSNIWLCDYIDTPFILGIRRPRIYLPSSMGEEQARQVIAHENAHIFRRDHWWKPLGFALLTVYWFQPLLWAAYALLCRDIELACDERVVQGMDAQAKKAYSQALLACSVPRRLIAACPLAFGEVGVKERVKSVLHYKRPAFWVTAAAGVACAAAAVCFLTDPVGYQAQICYNGVIWEQSGFQTETLPQGSVRVGMLKSVTHRTHDRPAADLHAVNLEEKYAGCPLWMGDGTLYLQDYGGFYLPFVAAERLVQGHIYHLYQSCYTVDHEDSALWHGSLLYAFTGDLRLLAREEGGPWQELGTMEPFDLTKDNFDALLEGPAREPALFADEGYTAGFRRDIGAAWRLVTGDTFYYLLEHEDISAVYLACGYYDREGETDPHSDDSQLRWLYEILPISQYRAGRVLSAAAWTPLPADGSHLGTVGHVRDTLFIEGIKYRADGNEFLTTAGELARQLQGEGRYWAEDVQIPYFADQDGLRPNIYPFYMGDALLYRLYQFPDGACWLAEGDNDVVYELEPLWASEGQSPGGEGSPAPEGGGDQSVTDEGEALQGAGPAQAGFVWQFRPALSSRLPVLPLCFELGETAGFSIQADGGELTDWPTPVSGFSGEQAFWRPMGPEGWAMAGEAEIAFSARYADGGEVSGSLRLAGTPAAGGMDYTVTLSGEGLALSWITEGTSLVISRTDATAAALQEEAIARALQETFSVYGQPYLAWHVLDSVTVCGIAPAGGGQSSQQTAVSLLACGQSFWFGQENQPALTTRGGCVPMVLTFDSLGAPWTLLESWQPNVSPGDPGYSAAVHEKIPPAVWEANPPAPELELALYQAVYDQVATRGDPPLEAYFDRQFTALARFPHITSNLHTLAEDLAALREPLLYFGDHTLGYVFGRLLAGEEEPTMADTLWGVAVSLLGEEALLESPYEGGQADFDGWKDYILRLYRRNDMDFMQAHYPKSCLLLELLEAHEPAPVDSAG